MGSYRLTKAGLDAVIAEWSGAGGNGVYAPLRYPEGGPYSDADVVRYGEVAQAGEIVLDEKTAYSFKEVLLPISQTLFFFTEETVKEADAEVLSRKAREGAIVFLRSCDLHAVQRLDEIYLRNAFEDHYYRRLRERVKFVVIGCPQPFDSCFCVDMGTNRSDGYDAALFVRDGDFVVDCREAAWEEIFERHGEAVPPEDVPFVEDTPTHVRIPDTLPDDVAELPLWETYDARCINCGRCNFVCPTCTCFTMQDVFYTDNGRVGERRRVWASCMVDGFTDVAGGGSYRKTNGQRMRFKNLHKIHDYKKRFGYHMCVGCGRCDDICPEYISFAESINRLAREAARETGKEERHADA